MKMKIYDRTLCADTFNFTPKEVLEIAGALIKAGVNYIEVPSLDFVKIAPSFGGYIFGDEREKLNLVYLDNIIELNEYVATGSDLDNVVVTSITGYGHEVKHLPTELAVMELLGKDNADSLYDLIYEYFKPRFTFAWGYDGLCALSAECRADEDYIEYFYEKGHKANKIRSILANVDMSRSVEFDIAYAEELLVNA